MILPWGEGAEKEEGGRCGVNIDSGYHLREWKWPYEIRYNKITQKRGTSPLILAVQSVTWDNSSSVCPIWREARAFELHFPSVLRNLYAHGAFKYLDHAVQN